VGNDDGEEDGDGVGEIDWEEDGVESDDGDTDGEGVGSAFSSVGDEDGFDVGERLDGLLVGNGVVGLEVG